MAYGTVEELRSDYLPQPDAGATMDAVLQNMLDKATEIVDGRLGFGFAAYGAASVRDVQLRAGNRLTWPYLELPAHQAGSVTLVQLVGARATTTEQLTTVTDWIEEESGGPLGGWLYRSAYWSAGFYRVTAKWGYGPAPESLVGIVYELAVNLFGTRESRQAVSGFLGVAGDGAVAYTRGLTERQRMVVDDTRRKYLGPQHA